MVYERTSRYRNWIKRRAWLPIIQNGVARLASGAVYIIDDITGQWRRARVAEAVEKKEVR